MAGRVRDGWARMQYLPQAMTLVWAAARGWTAVWLVLLVVQGVLPALSVTLTRSLVDSLVNTMADGDNPIQVRATLLLVLAVAAVLLLIQVLRSLTGLVRTAQSEYVQDHVLNLIHAKAAEVDFAFYETPAYYDQMHRAQVQAYNRPIQLLENLGSVLQNGVTFVAMAAVLVPYGAWLPLALLISALPAFYVVLQDAERQHRWQVRATVRERRARYFDLLLTRAESAAELRLFDLGGHFRALYQRLRRELRDEKLQLSRKLSLHSLVAGLVGLLVTGGVMAWMVWRALKGNATLGDLALLYQAFNQGQGLMRTLLQSAGQIYSNSLFLGDLFEYLELEPQVLDPLTPQPVPTQPQELIRFENVSFRYPDSLHMVLKEFNLSLPAGKMAAVVGPNGAGKSTLIKLLCRLYDPEEGKVTLDDTDLRLFNRQDLRQRITVLFQEPVHYHLTVGQNIGLGDLSLDGGDAICAAARSAAAEDFIQRLPQGYQTVLGKHFAEGTELSTGQWQRIALARAFVRSAPIILLDEPTSAMDSWAEADWLTRFCELARDRTALLITHRFTTAMYADIIHVMLDGRIIESGTHAELLTLDGFYASSWLRQMQQSGAESLP